MEISSINETTEDWKVGLSIHYIIVLVLIFSIKNHDTLLNKTKRRVKLSSSTGSYFHCKIGKERIFKKNYFKS